VKLYHRTSADAAEAILADGFRDCEYQIELPDGQMTGGVELCSKPYDPMALPPVKRERLLVVEIPGEVAGPWEWHIDARTTPEPTGWVGFPQRDFFIPAEIVNRYGPPKIVPEDD
jgi:hypothetical protein